MLLFVLLLLLLLFVYRLLDSLARVYAKYPSHEDALMTSLQTLPLFSTALPSNALHILTQIQSCALEAFSSFDFNRNPSLVDQALKFIFCPWSEYPFALPPSTNMKHLALLVGVALQPELDGASRSRQAILSAALLTENIIYLSDSQMEALAKEGVFKHLRHLMAFYDEMSEEHLLKMMSGIHSFAELHRTPMEFIDDNSYIGILQCALKYPSNEAIQTRVWQLFRTLCNSHKHFAKSLFEAGLLNTMTSLLQSEGVFPLPAVNFLMLNFLAFRNVALSNKELIGCLADLIKVDVLKDKEADLKLEALLCEFLSRLCSCGMIGLNLIFELNLVNKLLDCARAHPDEHFTVLACVALEGVSNSIPPASFVSVDTVKSLKAEFSDQNYHEFIREMLSHPQVYNNPKLIKTFYITFQKVLRPMHPEDLKNKVHTRDFIEFFIVSFIRDTSSFRELVPRVVFTTHYFIFEMKHVDTITILKDLEFHKSVADLLEKHKAPDTVITVMGMLACIVGKYYEYLKSVKPFVEAHVPYLLLEKAKMLGTLSQFSDDFGRVMLNLTADKELSLELFEKGYLDKLLEVRINDESLKVRRSVIHAIGNIALGGLHVKQVLLDKCFYESLFSILRGEMKTAEPFLISACCRVLHILASGDWVKRKFVESGCIELLLQVMKARQDNAEIQWRPLGLLSSLGFMAVINRRFILTDEILEVVASILQKSKNGKVISYTTLVFLGSDELDLGAIKLRHLGIVENLQTAIDNSGYRKQAPDLERWGVHVLEKQNLYTLSLPSSSQLEFPSSLPEHQSSYWPPYIPKEAPVDTNSPNTSSPHESILLPLEEIYFKSNTPIAPELSDHCRSQLSSLGLDLTKPLFRIGRLYGSTHGLCSNCDKESPSEELVIRPLGMTVDQYQQLVDCGWYRRGGVKMFRLRHNHNIECCDWETRVLVHKFDYTKHKSYKKVLKRMPTDRLTVETCHAHFNREAFDLYNEYHVKKHDKPLKSEYSYCEHIVNTPTSYQVIDGVEYGTFHQMYRLDGKLVAVGIIDVIPRGMVSIYMWYDVSKETAKYSFGVYSALKEIEMVKRLGEKNPNMEYYYLQGWNNNNKKLSYKANYEPEEFYCPCIVKNWVAELDGVEKSKKAVIEKEIPPEETDGHVDAEPPKETLVSSNQNALQGKVKPTNNDSTTNNSNSAPVKSIESVAFPLDQKRYENETGGDLDISKIVVCLNYVKFMYLEDLFRDWITDTSQREIIETRFKELYASLSPDLRSQLVVDMMVAHNSTR